MSWFAEATRPYELDEGLDEKGLGIEGCNVAFEHLRWVCGCTYLGGWQDIRAFRSWISSTKSFVHSR